LEGIVKDKALTVLILPNDRFSVRLLDITKYLTENYQALCYVNLNKLHQTLSRNLEKNKINQNKILFIDGISKTINKDIKEPRNCLCVTSPSSLSELGIVIGKALKTKKFDAFVFNSLSTLLVYNPPTQVRQFVHKLASMLSEGGMTGVFTLVEGDKNTRLIKEIGLYADKVTELK
tara:strand:- start:1411 stop:1938 length:528 start_codon:yes stop_codon:yes gene_type:complete